MVQKKKGLGRGLEALLGEAKVMEEDNVSVQEIAGVEEVSIHAIKTSEFQPRKNFDKEKIEELAESIREHGIIQPIIVRKKGDGYEIVAGERRWRASREAGLKKVPVIVKEISDRDHMLFAIIENVQREELNPIEEAASFEQMIKKYDLTQEEVSKSVGKSRPYISNQLRLLKLPEAAREYVAEGKVSAGHAKVLISIKDEEKLNSLAKEVAEKGISVRELENRLKEKPVKAKKKDIKAKTPEAKLLERELKEKFGTKVEILENGKNGKIEINYFNKEERERIIEILMKI